MCQVSYNNRCFLIEQQLKFSSTYIMQFQILNCHAKRSSFFLIVNLKKKNYFQKHERRGRDKLFHFYNNNNKKKIHRKSFNNKNLCEQKCICSASQTSQNFLLNFLFFFFLNSLWSKNQLFKFSVGHQKHLPYIFG